MKVTDDFVPMTSEIAQRMDVRLELLQELEGGRSGARTFLVSVMPLQPSLKPSHMILRLENARWGGRAAAGLLLAQSSLDPVFVRDHMVELGHEPITCGNVTATLYKLAGGSLTRWLPLSSYSKQSVLVEFYAGITEDILNQFCSGNSSLRHPQQLLESWLSGRIERIESFLTKQQVDSKCEGYVFRPNSVPAYNAQPQILPNPLWYLQEPECWGAIRKIDVLKGRSHGDLHPGNVLACTDDLSFKKYVLIDFDRYQPDSFLFFDLRSLELGFLIGRSANVNIANWKDMLDALANTTVERTADELPLDLSGPFTLANAGRKRVLLWIRSQHPDKTDDLVAQYLLAAVAAGLTFCSKESLSVRERWFAFLYAAVHLNAALVQLGAWLPARATELQISPPSEREERVAIRRWRKKQLRRIGYVAIILLIISMVTTYVAFSRYSAIASDFQPAWTEEPHPNASSEIRLYESNELPKSVEWFRYAGENQPLTPLGTESLAFLHLSPSKYIFFRSMLSDKNYTWTGLFLHRLPWLPSLGLFRWRGRDAHDLILVLDCQMSDMLELGLKDAGGGEEKIVVPTRPGWTGYRIPLADFSGVNVADLDQLIIAHSHTVGSGKFNIFKIALAAIR